MTGGAKPQPLRIVVLISGGGRTLVNFLRLRELGQLDVDIPLVISSSSKAKGLDHARAAGIPTQVIARSGFASDEDYGTAMFAAIRAAEPLLVVMAGFLKFVPIPDDFTLRVVNIHPSLIPEFCGHGMYGHHVHEAVIAAGAKASGCTVHYVDNQYDHGPIILQKSVPVLPDDTPDTLAARVFGAECEAFPEALRQIAAGQVKVS